jgi:hypothetical protein
VFVGTGEKVGEPAGVGLGRLSGANIISVGDSEPIVFTGEQPISNPDKRIIRIVE